MNPLPWHKRLLYGLTNWGLFVAGALNLAVGTWSAINAQVAIAGTSLTAGLVLLFAATIDRFESLKGLGIEAKTRQLDLKIEQADEALRRLKELAELTGGTLMDLNSKMGRWDSAPGPRESYALAQKVRSIMVALGSDEAAMFDALKPWAQVTCFDLASALIAPLNTALFEKISELERKRAALAPQSSPDDPEHKALSESISEAYKYRDEHLNNVHKLDFKDFPDRLRKIVDETPLLDERIIGPVRLKVNQFAPAMINIREALRLDNPEPYFIEIEKYQHR